MQFSKFKCFHISSLKTGQVWRLQSDKDAELNEWICFITECRKENNNEIDYELVKMKIFNNVKRDDDDKSSQDEAKNSIKSIKKTFGNLFKRGVLTYIFYFRIIQLLIKMIQILPMQNLVLIVI